MSPVSSATERFHQTPNKATKVQLFKSANTDPPPPLSSTINNNNSDKRKSTDNTNNDDTPNSTSCENNGTTITKKNNNNNNSSNRAGSLGLFFRKFYKLAYIRMKELCKELGLVDDELLKKIWTIFEYSIVERTELMRDRHLDQILMCAIYVFNRVTHLNKTFTEIMKFYRNQPQSDSHIYRSVLISHKCDNNKELNKKSGGAEAPIPKGPQQPSDLAGTSTSHENETRGDIIGFYNTVYVQKMQEFAMRFSDQSPLVLDVILSPLPRGRCPLQSPKKISANHSLYVHPLERLELPQSPSSLTYSFHKSPAKVS